MVGTLAVVGSVYAFSAVVTLAAVYWAWRHGTGTERRLFVAAGAAALAWTATITAQLVGRGSLQIRLFQLGWIVRWVSTLAWLVFVMAFTGRNWRRPATLGSIAIVFTIAGVAIGTSHYTGLVFSEFAVADQPIPHVTFQREAGYFLLAVIAFGIIGYIFYALGRVALTTRRESRRQAVALGVGLVAPVVIALAQTTGVLPYRWVRYTALGNGIQMLCVAYGIFGGSLFRTRPITRSETIEAMADPILVLGDDGLVVDFNDAARSVFPDLAGGHPVEHVAPTLVADPDAGVPDGLADRLEMTPDGPTVASDTPIGTDADVEPGTEERTLVVSAHGVERGTVVVCRDVTEVERYAAQLERQTDRLDQFASTVSHDLRNPLTVAEGYVELIEQTTDDETTQAHIDRVQSAHDRMSDLIEDTLALARQGAVVDETEPIDLASFAANAWQFVDGGSELDTTDADGYTVEADPGRLRSAFENLFRNAIEHGGDDVTVTVGASEELFYVADDGPGIPPEDRADVFDEGFTTNQDGTGFGLAIVRSVATAHGGDVCVTEAADGGARFEFTGFTVSTGTDSGTGATGSTDDAARADDATATDTADAADATEATSSGSTGTETASSDQPVTRSGDD